MACNSKHYYQVLLYASVALSLNSIAAPEQDASISVEEEQSDAFLEEAAQEQIDLSLIEFLGQWETDDGLWISPADLADDGFIELIETAESLEMEEID